MASICSTSRPHDNTYGGKHKIIAMQLTPGHTSKRRTVAPTSTRPGPPQMKLLSRSATSWVYAEARHIYKISRDAEQLRREYHIHNTLNTVFNAASRVMHRRGKPVCLPYVPVCFDWHPDLSALRNLRAEANLSGTTAALAMEYIRPLHDDHVRYLVKRHLSCMVQKQALQSASETHNVVRVCLGDVKPSTDAWQIGLHDRHVYLDQLYQEKVDFDHMAAAMGSALAIIHWSCGLDAAGVHFTLGCDQLGRIQLWILDFSRCKSFEKSAEDVRSRLVSAVEENGCVWPRWIDRWPFENVWFAFKRAYLHMSQLVFAHKQADNGNVYLPLLFLQSLSDTRGPETALQK